MPIIIAQGLPEIPHHVLGNLRIKIAGWSAKWFFEAQTAGTDKHGGLVVVWLSSSTDPGTSRVLHGTTFGNINMLLTNIGSNRSLCLTSIRGCTVRYLVVVALFFFRTVCTVSLCYENYCCLWRNWFVVEMVNGGRALISSQPLAPSLLSSSSAPGAGL